MLAPQNDELVRMPGEKANGKAKVYNKDLKRFTEKTAEETTTTSINLAY